MAGAFAPPLRKALHLAGRIFVLPAISTQGRYNLLCEAPARPESRIVPLHFSMSVWRA